MTDTAAPDPRQGARELFPDKLAAGWRPAGLDTYCTADGRPWFSRVRFDPPQRGGADDKFIRPIHHDGQRWRIGEPPAPPQGKPLFLLPALLALDSSAIVHVVEGEKAARALQRLGLAVTTSGSASSAAAADWSPLAGRRVRIWPDHDEAGARYAQEVAQRLQGIRCTVEMLDPAGLRLPPKGDAHDWHRTNREAGGAQVAALPWRPTMAWTSGRAAAVIHAIPAAAVIRGTGDRNLAPARAGAQ